MSEAEGSLMLEDAKRVVAAAEEEARRIEQPMDIAVVDGGANLKAFSRMDGGFIGSIDISINKAFTSVAFEAQTKDLGELAQVGQPLYGINTTNGGRVVVFGGGIPLVRGGRVIGAVGVSTGTVGQDQRVAEAGAAAL
ncbi:MAG: heme-binding protein [Rubrobacter sp.]|nr:heme-binding protein [Rubrobacter sp.]